MKFIIFTLIGLFIYNILVVGPPEFKVMLLIGALVGAGAWAKKELKNGGA